MSLKFCAFSVATPKEIFNLVQYRKNTLYVISMQHVFFGVAHLNIYFSVALQYA